MWARAYFLIAVFAALVTFTGAAGPLGWIAKTMFVVFAIAGAVVWYGDQPVASRPARSR